MSVVQQYSFRGFNFFSNAAWIDHWEEQFVVTDNTQAVPGTDVAPARQAYLGPRIIKASGRIGGAGITTRDLYRSSIDGFNKAMSYGAVGALTKDSDRFVNAKCIQNTLIEDNYINSATFDLTFTCPDPYYYDTASATALALTNPSSGDTVGIANGGTASMFAFWTIVLGGAGTNVGTITLSNITTGVSWSFGPTSMTAGDSLVVDPGSNSCTLAGVNKLISFSGIFWSLPAGNSTVEITFSGTGIAIASVSLFTRNRYL